jgi:hypothetical protein
LLRRYDPLRVSLAVERLNPDLKSLLVSYVQLEPDCDDSGRASPQLIEAVRRQAVRQAGPLDFLAVVDFRRIRSLLLATAAVLAVFALSGVFAGEFYRVLAVRLVDPNSSLGYPTRTQILAETGDQKVQQGKPLTLSLTAGGEVPDEALLQIRYGDGPWEKVRLPGDEDDTFTYEIKQCSGSFVYHFRVGDAVSPRYYKVEVVPAPQIVQAVVKLRYPKYANQPEQETGSLNFEALEGSEIVWQVRCDQPLANARMACEPGEVVPMTVDPDDPSLVRATMKAARTLAYQFQWRHAVHQYDYTDGVRYSLRVLPDEPPVVEVLPPLPEEKGTLKKNLTIRFRAQDTYGLGQAWIVYSVNGGPEQGRAAGVLSGRSADRTVTWRPADSIRDLKEDDVLTYLVKVYDNHEGDRGPGAGRSKGLRLHFLSTKDYMQYVLETKAELFTRLRGLQEDEHESSNTIKTLRTEIRP